MHIIAAGPPSHKYGPEVPTHVVVDGPMVWAHVGTERTVSIIDPNSGGNSIHNVGFSGGNLSQGRRAYYVM